MKNIESSKLIKHIQTEHHGSPLASSIKEVIFGGIDGIITTFAVVCGFSGAFAMDTDIASPFTLVLLFGLANLFADGFSMGLGEFISARSNNKMLLKEYNKELSEIRHNPQDEYEETLMLLQEQGFSYEDASTLTKIYSGNESFWVDFMLKYELNLQYDPDPKPFLGGLITFVSFVSFGFIPLLPYLLGIIQNTFLWSILFTGLALIILGLMRHYVTTEKTIVAIAEVLLIGMVAALIAYGVGALFEGRI